MRLQQQGFLLGTHPHRVCHPH